MQSLLSARSGDRKDRAQRQDRGGVPPGHLAHVGAIAAAQRARERQRFDEAFRLIKLETVRSYYPEMRRLSNREIALRYDYDDAYWKIR